VGFIGGRIEVRSSGRSRGGDGAVGKGVKPGFS
jgi:hypothetical protein